MVRTRFAPSPTGFLHIGGARTALYSWLYARHMQGQFILRIEDTDLERSTPESVQAILDGMDWLNLGHDEGPHYQTKRFDRYREVIEQLLTEGKAYKCYCSKERLDEMRDAQMKNKEKPRYDGKCRALTEPAAGAFVVRFKNPQEGSVVFDDAVSGKISIANQELDDLIIARSDGTPTYNFTVVVDDMDMKITHVIRGTDHINNTPRQINILRALDAAVPVYAHVPMILGEDGKKLSKRTGAVSVMQFRDEGFLPEAILNYLARLGWSHGDQEVFSVAELTELFDITGLNKSAAAMNMEKLLWLNQHYMKTSDPLHVAQELAWHMREIGVNTEAGPALEDVVSAQAERTKTLREMAEKSRYFYEPVTLNDDMRAKIPKESLPALQMLAEQLAKLPLWGKEDIHKTIKRVAEIHDLKMGKVAQPLRILMTGGTVSPSIDTTILLIGKARALQRLEMAVA